MVARRLFNQGTAYARGIVHPDDRRQIDNGNVEHLWSDAEQFLDLLETAAGRDGRDEKNFLSTRLALLANRLDNSLHGPMAVRAIRDAARRLLALECSKFLLGADPESERWEPFRRWRGILRAHQSPDLHTIITFNYDRVLEVLGFRDWVLLPDESATLADHVLKMHGSVDWKRTETGFERQPDEHFAATCRPEELAIAPPGPSKAEMTKKLEPLWNLAEQRLKVANAVCFLGYRFPETDATARRRLLAALPTGHSAQAHVVLGPNVHHPDVERLQGLLRYRLNEYRITVHPMFAQDFLSVFDPEMLPPQ
jgi:hypothetical protein